MTSLKLVYSEDPHYRYCGTHVPSHHNTHSPNLSSLQFPSIFLLFPPISCLKVLPRYPNPRRSTFLFLARLTSIAILLLSLLPLTSPELHLPTYPRLLPPVIPLPRRLLNLQHKRIHLTILLLKCKFNAIVGAQIPASILRTELTCESCSA